jgi:hypothetical protein
MAAEKVGDLRRTGIQSALDLFHEISRTLLDGDHCQQRTISAKKSIMCDYVIFGSLCRAMSKIRGSLLPKSVDDITESVVSFYSSANILISSIMCITDHSSCSPAPDLEKRLEGTLVLSKGAIVTPSDKLYMKKQRQKSGLYEAMAIRRKLSEGKR